MIMIAEASATVCEEVLDEVPEMSDKPDAVKVVPNRAIDFEIGLQLWRKVVIFSEKCQYSY